MFLDMNGPDFIRVQQGANVRQGDPLHPDVIFSGAYDDGTCMFFDVSIGAAMPNIAGHTINFGKTFAIAPLVFGSLRLTQAESRDGVSFSAGECLAPMENTRTVFGTGPVKRFMWNFTVNRDSINLVVGSFTGVASFMVMDYY